MTKPAPVKPEPLKARKGALVGGSIAAALALATPLVMEWEGKRNDPYYDIVRVRTVCYGSTGPHIQNRRYSDAECMALLRRDIERHAAPVFRCAPGLRDRPYEAAASVSLAYNIGVGAFCSSTAARRFNRGDWQGGCQAIARFNRAGGKVVRGLVNRRRGEVTLCLKGTAQ